MTTSGRRGPLTCALGILLFACSTGIRAAAGSGDPSTAIDSLPPHPDIVEARARFERDPAGSVAALERLHSLPSPSRAHQIDVGLALAQGYSRAGRFAEANLLSEALATAPDIDELRRSQATQVRTEALQALGRFDDAAKLASASAQDSMLASASVQVGETFTRLGDRRRASAHLQEALHHFERAGQVQAMLVVFPPLIDSLEALGKHADALKAMRAFKALSDDLQSQDDASTLATAPAPPQSVADVSPRIDALPAAPPELHADSESIARGWWLFGVAILLTVIAMLLARLRRHARTGDNALHPQGQRLQALAAPVVRQNRDDPLTGLHNRLFLIEYLANRAASRSPPPLLLILIDIDHFGEVNSVHGHAVGDLALRMFADVLRELAAPENVLVRWGGEEFIWLIESTDADEGRQRCEQVQQRLRRKTLEHAGTPIALQVSMGFAPLPVWAERKVDWTLSLRLADYALFQSKAFGRNRWTGYRGGVDPGMDSGREEWTAEALEQVGCVLRLTPDDADADGGSKCLTVAQAGVEPPSADASVARDSRAAASATPP